jgi:hypothetical protein
MRSVLVLVAVLVLAGCASTTPTAQPTTAQSTTARPTTASPTPTPTPTPTPAPTPTTPPPTKAADGANARACADGVCEVKVTGGWEAALPRFDLAALNVETVRADTVTMVFSITSGRFDLACDRDPKCGTYVMGPSGGSSTSFAIVTAHAGARVNLNSLAVDVAAIDRRSVVLRINPR